MLDELELEPGVDCLLKLDVDAFAPRASDAHSHSGRAASTHARFCATVGAICCWCGELVRVELALVRARLHAVVIMHGVLERSHDLIIVRLCKEVRRSSDQATPDLKQAVVVLHEPDDVIRELLNINVGKSKLVVI